MTKIILLLFIAINIFCFLRVGTDKRLAENGDYNNEKNKQHRIAEVSLISYSALGGAIGTLIAFKVYNHKVSTKKGYLRRNIYIILIENIILYLSLYFNFRKLNNKFNK